jgi:hypothetical protein
VLHVIRHTSHDLLGAELAPRFHVRFLRSEFADTAWVRVPEPLETVIDY